MRTGCRLKIEILLLYRGCNLESAPYQHESDYASFDVALLGSFGGLRQVYRIWYVAAYIHA